jgi:hypothetical protein
LFWFSSGSFILIPYRDLHDSYIPFFEHTDHAFAWVHHLALAAIAVPSLAAPFVYDSKHDLFFQSLTTFSGVGTFLGIPCAASTPGEYREALGSSDMP